jgi:hypothetical protein
MDYLLKVLVSFLCMAFALKKDGFGSLPGFFRSNAVLLVFGLCCCIHVMTMYLL